MIVDPCGKVTHARNGRGDELALRQIASGVLAARAIVSGQSVNTPPRAVVQKSMGSS